MGTHSNNKQNMKTIKSLDGKIVVATDAQAKLIKDLMSCRSGGGITVYGYKPSTRVVEQPVYDIQMITKISVLKLYERKISAIKSVSFEDIAELSAQDEKLKELSASALLDVFNKRKLMEVTSMEKTLNGIRDNAHRQGHDDYYARFDKGVKANVTQLENGKYAIKSIMLTYLEIGKTTIVEGSYKSVNSGAPVRMSNLIKKLTNQKSHGIKTLSLKEDNFDSLKIGRKELKPDGLKENAQDAQNVLKAKLAKLYAEYSYLL